MQQFSPIRLAHEERQPYDALVSEHRNVTLGLVQMSMEDATERNMEKAIAMSRDAAGRGAKIVALPELFLGPYFCVEANNAAAFERAEKIPGTSTEALASLAKECRIVLVGGSIYEFAGKTRYNTCCIFGPDGGILGTYRKLHIPHDPGFFEQHYFASGNEPPLVVDTPHGRIGVGICYDQWFPEFARLAALQGAELLVYPTAIGTADVPPVDEAIPENWEEKWRAAQVGHAASNDLYVAAVNRVGHEGQPPEDSGKPSATHFFGGSFVADPNARLLARGDDTEQILLADIDLAYPKKMQEAWRFLAERRPDMYGGLTK
ncbi:acyltransferase [Candidatus Peribacteria bacterium]|nr:acyltransferase [Candidatus Peribacteria bacterium]